MSTRSFFPLSTQVLEKCWASGKKSFAKEKKTFGWNMILIFWMRNGFCEKHLFYLFSTISIFFARSQMKFESERRKLPSDGQKSPRKISGFKKRLHQWMRNRSEKRPQYFFLPEIKKETGDGMKRDMRMILRSYSQGRWYEVLAKNEERNRERKEIYGERKEWTR